MVEDLEVDTAVGATAEGYTAAGATAADTVADTAADTAEAVTSKDTIKDRVLLVRYSKDILRTSFFLVRNMQNTNTISGDSQRMISVRPQVNSKIKELSVTTEDRRHRTFTATGRPTESRLSSA